GRHLGTSGTDADYRARARNLFVKAGVEERAQTVAAAGVAQLAQRLGLNLPDAFAGDREMLANFFERMLAAVLQTEAHLDDLFFARAQGLQNLGGLLAQIEVDHRFRR